jgi:hypothetical protein
MSQVANAQRKEAKYGDHEGRNIYALEKHSNCHNFINYYNFRNYLEICLYLYMIITKFYSSNLEIFVNANRLHRKVI